MQGVLEGRLDLGLAAPIPSNDPRIASRKLADQPLALVIPTSHRLAARRRVRLTDVAGEPFITMTVGYGLRTITDNLLRAARLPIRYAFESQEMTTAAGLVAAGLGVAVLPGGIGAQGTHELALADRGASRTISLAWSADRRLSTPVAELRRHIIGEAPALLRSPAPTA
ncbi:MAG: LysR-family transcriptional regulator [Frankiales bacterium]|nr:LysR-family transcriptional regulator [Frankiales bacterium]